MPTGSGFTSDNTERFGTLTKPDRVGYNFQGYYTGSNGGGTQYYTSEMNSSRS